MTEVKNTLTIKENHSIDTIIEEINSTIFSKENWNDTNFYKIPEVTYSYDILDSGKNLLNLTLFCDIGGLDIEKFKNSEKSGKEELLNNAILNLNINIKNKIETIEKYIKKIHNIDSNGSKSEESKKKIIIGGLGENINFLKLAKEGLLFEKEKALIGLYFKDNKTNGKGLIPEDERDKKLKKIYKLNTKLYGESPINNLEHINDTINYFYEKKNVFEKSGKTLTKEEESRYYSYLNKLQELNPEHNAEIIEKPKKVVDSSFLDKEINKEDILKLFNLNFKALDEHSGNMPHIAEFGKVGSISDTPTGLYYPQDIDSYEKIELERVIRLLGHEIGQHSVSIVSHNSLVGNIRGKKNLELAEGTASFLEMYFMYGKNLLKNSEEINGNKIKIIDIEKLDTIPIFPKMIMEEILTDEEFYDFLTINNKIEGDTTPVLERYLRHKRTGFQRKDITYNTGMIKTAKYINSYLIGEKPNGKFSDLFLGKVGFDEIDDLKKIKESKENIKLPENIMFHEMFYFQLEQRKLKKEVTVHDFLKYLGDKYPFINLEENSISELTETFNKILLAAVELTEAAIESNEVKTDITKVRKKVDEILNTKKD